MQVFVRAHGHVDEPNDEVHHIRRLNHQALWLVFERVGFRIEDMKYFDSLGIPAALGVWIVSWSIYSDTGAAAA